MAGFCSWAGNQTDKPYHIPSEPQKPSEGILFLDFRVKVYVFRLGFGTVGPATLDLIKDNFLTSSIAFPKSDLSDHHDRCSCDTKWDRV